MYQLSKYSPGCREGKKLEAKSQDWLMTIVTTLDAQRFTFPENKPSQKKEFHLPPLISELVSGREVPGTSKITTGQVPFTSHTLNLQRPV